MKRLQRFQALFLFFTVKLPGRFLKKDRYNEKYKLDETTKKALLLEILCDM